MNTNEKLKYVSYRVSTLTVNQLMQCYKRDCKFYSGRGKKIKRLNPGDHLFIRHCNNDDLLIVSAVHDETGHTIVLASGVTFHFPINLGKLNLPLSIYHSDYLRHNLFYVKYVPDKSNAQWEIQVNDPSISE